MRMRNGGIPRPIGIAARPEYCVENIVARRKRQKRNSKHKRNNYRKQFLFHSFILTHYLVFFNLFTIGIAFERLDDTKGDLNI